MESEENRQCYRRWARASSVVYLIIFAALMIGLSLYDTQTTRVAHNDLTAGIDVKAIAASSENTGADRGKHDF